MCSKQNKKFQNKLTTPHCWLSDVAEPACGSSLEGLNAGVIFAFAGRALNGKYGLSAVNGSPGACVGLAPGPVYTGQAGLSPYACKKFQEFLLFYITFPKKLHNNISN